MIGEAHHVHEKMWDKLNKVDIEVALDHVVYSTNDLLLQKIMSFVDKHFQKDVQKTGEHCWLEYSLNQKQRNTLQGKVYNGPRDINY